MVFFMIKKLVATARGDSCLYVFDHAHRHFRRTIDDDHANFIDNGWNISCVQGCPDLILLLETRRMQLHHKLAYPRRKLITLEDGIDLKKPHNARKELQPVLII